MIYLDHAASTPILPSALSVLKDSFEKDFANPSAKHRLGRELAKKLEASRAELKQLLGSDHADQLIFTSSATEANNLLIKSFKLKENESVLFSEGDHPSLVVPARSLSKKNGQIRLILLSHVNNHSGEKLDLRECCLQLKKQYPEAHIHVDASQSFTKFEIDCQTMPFDSLSLSAQKMGGPRGVGALWFRKNVKLIPLFEGGGQEFSLRSSTEALSLILAFVEAAKEGKSKQKEHFDTVQNLFTKLISGLDHMGLVFPFVKKESGPYILTFIIPGISSDIVLRLLEEKEIYISSSSACSSKIKGHSAVFSALGIEERYHKNVLRISLSHLNTENEIDTFIQQLKSILAELSFLKK